MEHGKEKLDAKQSAGAGIVQACFEREKAEAHGRYVASLIGPREECRAEYIDLRGKHQQFVMLGDELPGRGRRGAHAQHGRGKVVG